MTESHSHRRLAENEVVFRSANQQVQKDLQTLNENALKEGHLVVVKNDDAPLHFYCECANEKCRQRIVLRPSEYQKAHKNICNFIVLVGHEIPSIERIVSKKPAYVVVEKFETPPKAADALNKTDAEDL
ncbi:MAG TPA: hypothetical protein VJ836_02425 [Candidatus Saccharimonadales bacterium]|nr:hypothetical protein [Candidatus Saccharimonadales bacterium]